MKVKDLKNILANVEDENREIFYFDYSNREINGFYYTNNGDKREFVLTNLYVQPFLSKV